MTISFWLILLAVLAYGLLHSLLASLKTKARVHQWFGPSIDRWFRLTYNLIAVFTLLPILFLPILLIDKEIYAIRYPWLILSLTIQVLVVFILIVGLRQTGITSFIGLRQFLLPEDTFPSRLVTTWVLPLRPSSPLHCRVGLYLAYPYHDVEPTGAESGPHRIYIYWGLFRRT